MCSPLRLIRLPLHVCWVFTRNPPNQIRIGSGKRIKKWMQTKETGWNVGMWLSYPYLDYGLDRLGLPQFSQWIGNTDSTVILKCPNFLGILQLDLQCAPYAPPCPFSCWNWRQTNYWWITVESYEMMPSLRPVLVCNAPTGSPSSKRKLHSNRRVNPQVWPLTTVWSALTKRA